MISLIVAFEPECVGNNVALESEAKNGSNRSMMTCWKWRLLEVKWGKIQNPLFESSWNANLELTAAVTEKETLFRKVLSTPGDSETTL